MTTGNRKTHDFCWINLNTPKGSAAREFFGKLFGWRYDDMPGAPGASLIHLGDKGAGALMDLDIVKMPVIPPSIGVMVKVEDVDATLTRAKSLGGRAEGDAFTIDDKGRMAMVSDPNGAVFGIWQPITQQGIDVDTHAHGAPSWFETLTSDAKRAGAFYGELFGWKVEDEAIPGGTYMRFKLGTVPIGGALQMADVPPHWGVYFAVDDASASAKRAIELGASQCIPPREIPGVGRFAMLTSPEGVTFSIIEYSRP